jgi:hypothetical protein
LPLKLLPGIANKRSLIRGVEVRLDLAVGKVEGVAATHGVVPILTKGSPDLATGEACTLSVDTITGHSPDAVELGQLLGIASSIFHGFEPFILSILNIFLFLFELLEQRQLPE